MKLLTVAAAACSVASALAIGPRQIPDISDKPEKSAFNMGKVTCGNRNLKNKKEKYLNEPLNTKDYARARTNFNGYCNDFGVARSSLYVSVVRDSVVYTCARRAEGYCYESEYSQVHDVLDGICGPLKPGRVKSKDGRRVYGRANVGDILCYGLGEHRAWHYRHDKKPVWINGTMEDVARNGGVTRPRVVNETWADDDKDWKE